ncbi:anti-sigma regulatory factor (Ser/Thr protein kinase) [Amycolatopsis lexingtonensis]|uniref:Anti-sigma regulatory factor (Ser/Thr protein kinase) n=1 Tax=Amycolatopsis lexingtonensis TaxID=218822 RepID=A0ABR9HZN9_9PSEU|nr:SpoIIE family protein phosphatase [Amycolatopsis lexingtonensis]MBE1496409.1 anti-sigma regulatory factor (Ser/Thr protein kinase) [Amycolatopsis lexingtonensis]
MTATVAEPTLRIRVDHPSAGYAAARVARETARAAGLPDVLAERAAVVATELAGNIDKHTIGGSLFVQRSLTGRGVEVLAADDGPGMADLDHWLLDGNTTTATLGAGLGAVLRMATEFRITSSPAAGTLAAARLLAPAPAPPGGAVGHFRLAREDEQHCGDAVALADVTGSRTAVVADGLGHGPDAAEAAEAAVRVFTENPDRPLSHQLTNMHRALRTTRGAAVALVRIAPRRLEFCGVGNVSGASVGSGASRLLLSTPGVVGFTLPSAPVRHVELADGDVVVLHTDGVGTGWRVPGRVPDLLLLAAELAHRHRNPRDDAAMLALRVDRSG